MSVFCALCVCVLRLKECRLLAAVATTEREVIASAGEKISFLFPARSFRPHTRTPNMQALSRAARSAALLRQPGQQVRLMSGSLSLEEEVKQMGLWKTVTILGEYFRHRGVEGVGRGRFDPFTRRGVKQ